MFWYFLFMSPQLSSQYTYRLHLVCSIRVVYLHGMIYTRASLQIFCGYGGENNPDILGQAPVSFVVALDTMVYMVFLDLLFHPRRSNKFGIVVRRVLEMSLRMRQF
jgi:hypothetical protein